MNEPKNLLKKLLNLSYLPTIQNPSVRLKCTLQTEEDQIFRNELSIDSVFLDWNSVLHIIDTHTRFSSATFLDSNGDSFGQSVEELWKAFVQAWLTMCTGYSNPIQADQGYFFTSDL